MANNTFDFLRFTQNDLLNKQLRKIAEASVYEAAKTDFKSQSKALRQNAIRARMSAIDVIEEAKVARSDVFKQTDAAIGGINVQLANTGFDVNTGTAETLKLQQGIEGTVQASNVFNQGLKVADQLVQQANDFNLKRKELEKQFNFFYSPFKPKN